MSPLAIFCFSIVTLFGLGFFIPVIPLPRQHRARFSLICSLLGGTISLFWSLYFLTRSSPADAVLFSGSLPIPDLPQLAVAVYVDRFAAFFTLLVSGFSVAVSIYSFDYLGLHKRSAGSLEADAHGIVAAYSLFVGTLLLVIVANNLVPLLTCLEVSSLAFGYLVLFRHNKGRDAHGVEWSPVDRRARKLAIQSYLISSHVSLVLFMVALLLRAGQVGSFNFAAFRTATVPAGPLVFVLAFLGLAIRAGVAPFHIWVPLAHPSSPTNTHALSLGVAIKIAIYLMIRVFFQFLGPIPLWWGLVVLIFSGLTAVVGVFYAIASRDLKTALSYHSVENIGIILVGVGLALMLASTSLRSQPGVLGLAGLALIAALYHTLNHAVFKGLLYLCTGAIEKLTGSVEYHRLGGLMRRFPWTSTAFLVGAVAIAGFPPFNGFVSEWLTLQGLFSALGVSRNSSALIPMAVIALAITLLALSIGLTAFAFVKIAGASVLGAPRGSAAWGVREVPWFVRSIFATLSGLCLVLGIVPGLIVSLLAQVTEGLGLPTTTTLGPENLTLVGAPSGPGSLPYSAMLNNVLLWLLAGGGALIVLAVMGRRIAEGKGRLHLPAPVWSSAVPYDSAHMQATEAYFSYQVYAPLRRSRPHPHSMEPEASSHVNFESEEPPRKRRHRILPEGLPISAHYEVIEVFRPWYNASLAGLLRCASWSTLRLQNGRVRMYMAYTALTLLGLLLAWLQWGGR